MMRNRIDVSTGSIALISRIFTIAFTQFHNEKLLEEFLTIIQYEKRTYEWKGRALASACKTKAVYSYISTVHTVKKADVFAFSITHNDKDNLWDLTITSFTDDHSMLRAVLIAIGKSGGYQQTIELSGEEMQVSAALKQLKRKRMRVS